MSGAAVVRAERAPREKPVVAFDPVRTSLEAFALFFLIQTALLLRSQHLTWLFFEGQSGPGHATELVGSIWPDQVIGLQSFAAVALSGILLARAGRRRLWALPAIVWFAVGFFGGPTLIHVAHPTPLGMGWAPPPGTPLDSPAWWAQLWAGALVDYGLALLPGAVIAATLVAASPTRVFGLRTAAGRLRGIRIRPEAAAAFALCCFLLWLAITSSTEATDPTQPWAAAPGLLAPFLFGLLLSVERPRLLWAALAVAFLMEINGSFFLPLDLRDAWPAALATLPFVAICAVGIAYRPITRAFERLRDAPVAALVLLNVLNVADAVLTWIAVHSHQAVEANPVVRMLGLPAKVLLVALIGVILLRVRPRAIVWGVAVLVAVIAWHVAGLYLTATV